MYEINLLYVISLGYSKIFYIYYWGIIKVDKKFDIFDVKGYFCFNLFVFFVGVL